ncbi:MAG: carotenoid oxygenase family protein [Caulobacteraceae bacterium]|nr:carotenoid oxygenase family protein [Caulobacteraceae bacterium]
MDGSQAVSPFLRGNFAPVRGEDDFELEVVGQLPAGLAGSLYRNGPNPQFEPDADYHWFIGDGMVHGFHVEDGKVRYANRYVRTPKWTLEHQAGRRLFNTWGDPRKADPLALGQDGGVANTNILWHAGRLLALEEGHSPTRMDPFTLETLGYVDLGGKVTAHPKIDPDTGEMVFFAYMDEPMPFSRRVGYGVADAAGRLTRRESFEAPYCSMIHDFMVTRGHVLIPVLPLTGDLQRAMSGGPAFAWEPRKGAYVGVMRRDAGVESLRWFNTEANYVFHVMNAWEEGERIFADVMQYETAPLFPNADGGRGERSEARLVRWTFDLAGNSDTIKREAIDDLPGEFPRFDERRSGLSYRHGWFAAQTGKAGEYRADGIAHIDLTTGRRSTFDLPPGDAISEPVFVPRSAAAEEGDGWIVAVAYRAPEDRSEMLVLDAQDVAAGPIATAKVPRRVPFGFHGNWRPAT